jgi:hypothetical protein
MANDGVYWIDPDLSGTQFKPFQVYCFGMSTATPKEYLELKNVSTPTTVTSNYATYMCGGVHGQWACDCGLVTGIFTKVRIDPQTLLVDVGDHSFSAFAASTDQACLMAKSGCPGIPPYSTAQSCNGGGDASGSANVDLQGLPFHVAGMDMDTSMFKKDEDFNSALGYASAGGAMIDATRKVVTLTGGGDCGGFGAIMGLQLAQDP